MEPTNILVIEYTSDNRGASTGFLPTLDGLSDELKEAIKFAIENPEGNFCPSGSIYDKVPQVIYGTVFHNMGYFINNFAFETYGKRNYPLTVNHIINVCGD